MPLWMKIDVLYFNHPKVIQLPPVAQLLYLRAVAYSKIHLTDGLLSLAAIRSISYDLAASVQSPDPHATIEEWLAKMIEVGLFDRQEYGVSIHDFLEWNSSKQEVEFISDLRSKSGSKGGKTKDLRKQTASKKKANGKQKESKSLPIVQSTEYRDQSTEEEKSVELLLAEELDQRFEQEFWSCYPMRDGKKIGKALALDKYRQMKIEDRSLLAVAVKHLSEHPRSKNGIGIKDPHRWIKDGKGYEPWREWIEQTGPITTMQGHGEIVPCQARVEHGRTLRACGAPSVTPHGKAPRCAEHHKETTCTTQS